jgi:hypothetical protein
VSHKEACELRQLAQFARQPFEPIVVDLEHRLGSAQDTINSKFGTASVSSRVSWPISAGSDVSWFSPT